MADRQVAIAGEVYEVNMEADHDLSYQIPSSEFDAMLEEAGMSAEDAKETRRKLYGEGFQMARAWAAPQRDELRKSGLGAGYIDGVVAIVRREMLEAVGLSFVRSMEGEGDDSDAKVARRIKKGEGVPTFPKVDKATGLPDYEEFQEVALAIAQWVQVEHEGTGESMQGCLDDPDVSFADLATARGTIIDKALGMLLKGPCKLGDLANICEGSILQTMSGIEVWRHLMQQVGAGHKEALQLWYEAPPPIEHAYQVMQGLIEWKKVKDRLASLGVRSAKDERQQLVSLRGLLGGNAKTRGIIAHLEKHYGTKLRWDQLLDRVQDGAPVLGMGKGIYIDKEGGNKARGIGHGDYAFDRVGFGLRGVGDGGFGDTTKGRGPKGGKRGQGWQGGPLHAMAIHWKV